MHKAFVVVIIVLELALIAACTSTLPVVRHLMTPNEVSLYKDTRFGMTKDEVKTLLGCDAVSTCSENRKRHTVSTRDQFLGHNVTVDFGFSKDNGKLEDAWIRTRSHEAYEDIYKHFVTKYGVPTGFVRFAPRSARSAWWHWQSSDDEVVVNINLFEKESSTLVKYRSVTSKTPR